MSRFDVVVAPGVLADRRTAEEVFARALDRRGEQGTLLFPGSAAELEEALGKVAAAGEFGYLPADQADLGAQDLPGAPASVLRIDVHKRGADRSACVRRHIRGRGIDSLRFAVDAWHFHRAWPARHVSYGPDPDQHVEVRLPRGSGGGACPVAVLVHGGYWQSRWEVDLMDALAVDLAERGYVAWNLEYRRPDDHGWAATADDVAAGVAALATADPGAELDLDRVVLLGHSAGGQLVARLAADLAADPSAAVRPALTVSLAGVLDLDVADRRWLGEGSIPAALGGRRDELAEVYRSSSPVARLPIGLPVAVVCGLQDSLDLLDIGRSFAAAAVAAGDDVAVLEEAGNHFSVIDPEHAIWTSIAALVADRVPPGAGSPR
ncbi:alpha/beta hydrolase [Blastococcus sp. VKM Ac-2987]|uniref:alpha/beta hydrolase n=1 Tax=Blastococcus sp. VKM Ac-2987 TaxID=3004141 RepID=UPI0022ABA529|nr:alpha/beta fold hydrolase [Blastococcus sp. VKM Ac-2987]MCZ2857569.1 alpha/beta hydrolase fold domain-containing protein [Blastococcus sp. VKM Ac-2987]